MKNTFQKYMPHKYAESYKSLSRLGFPVLVTQLGIIVVSFADTLMVGAYGLNELAASAFVNSLFLIALVMLMGFAGGVTPIIGALYGKGDHEEGGTMLRASLQINLLLAVVFSVIMGVLYFFLGNFGQDEELLPVAREYYLIIMLSIIPLTVFNCFQQTANGTTDTASPMWLILIGDVLNIVGNYLLIFGHFGFPEMGLAGAGWSTLAARTFSALGIVAVFAFKRRYRPYWRSMLHSHAGGERRLIVWRTSYPLMIQSGVECGLWSVGAVVSGWHGKVQLASYQVMNTIGQLGFMIYMSIGWATSIRVANFTGTGNYKEVRRTTIAGLHMVLFLATVSSLIFFFFTTPLAHLFTPDDSVAKAALLLVGPLILYQYCDAIQLTFVNALRGASDVKPLLWISLTSYIAVGIPALFLLAETLGMETRGVYYSFSVALFTASLLLYLAFRRMIRKRTSN